MTTAQAEAVNVVLSHFAAQDSDPPMQVLWALYALAAAAADRVPDGWTADAVRAKWPAGFDDVQRAPADPNDPPVTQDAPVNSA